MKFCNFARAASGTHAAIFREGIRHEMTVTVEAIHTCAKLCTF